MIRVLVGPEGAVLRLPTYEAQQINDGAMT